MITGHVGQAIMWARGHNAMLRCGSDGTGRPPPLRLVADNADRFENRAGPLGRLLIMAERLESLAEQLQEKASRDNAGECRMELSAVAKVGTNLASVIRLHVERLGEVSP